MSKKLRLWSPKGPKITARPNNSLPVFLSILSSLLALGLATPLALLTSTFGLSGQAAASGVIAQLGLDIDGEAGGDFSGESVSFSSNGTRVAIGASANDGSFRDSGHVRIFDLVGSSWVQVGQDIDGEAQDDRSGYSVALSSDGSRVAIGAYGNDAAGLNAGHVRVFDWNGTSWVQVGSDIEGDAAGDRLGFSLAFSSNASRLAIGADFADGSAVDSGHVKVFDWNGTSWTQVGLDLEGEAANDSLGHSVALSADGSRVAAGAYGNDANGSSSGHVRVFDWNGSSWIRVGADIDGERAGDLSGYAASLSSDGSRLAIGASRNDGTAPDSGHVRIFDWDGSSWLQVGSDIDGEAAGDAFGVSVVLSSDGSRVAVGARENDGSAVGAGHVRIFDLTGVGWLQVVSDIDGEAAGDNSGHSLSMTPDGSQIAIGAYRNDGFAPDAGHVRVFSISSASSNSSLSGLSLSDGALSPSFASGTTDYTLTVDNAVASLTLTPIASDAGASINVNGVPVTSGAETSEIALSVGINTITTVVTAANSSTTSYTLTVTRSANPDSTLTSLTLSEGLLSPAFAAGTINYAASVEHSVSTVTVTPALSDSGASVTVNGVSVVSGAVSSPVSLSVGSNAITTIVTAADGSTTSYTVTLTRAASPDSTLSNLTISEGVMSPAFAPGATTYAASVENSVALFSLTPTLSDLGATVTVNGLAVTSGLATSESSLSVGSNSFTLVVTAADTTTTTYTIAVTRAAPAPLDSPGVIDPTPPATSGYFGPTFDTAKSAVAGSEVIFSGRKLNYVLSAQINGIDIEVIQAHKERLVLILPGSVLPGVYDLVILSSYGILTFQQGLEVLPPRPSDLTLQSRIKKLTVGSFNGYVAIYAKGYEGQRLSVKVGEKWLVVPRLEKFSKAGNLSRTLLFTEAGKTLKIQLFIDKKLVRTEVLKTK